MTSPDPAGKTPADVDASTTTPEPGAQPDSQPEPNADAAGPADGVPESSYTYVVRRHREPRLLRVLLIFTLLGIVALPLASYLLGETSTSDLAYFILFGAVIGGMVGGIVVLILDRLARGK